MIESLNTIRSLGLGAVFEDLYFGREVPAELRIHMNYPSEFRGTNLSDWKPLTEDRLIPIVDDGNFYEVCLYEPQGRKFVMKAIEEPNRTIREFEFWQQFLAYKLLIIADSGPGPDEVSDIAKEVGFRHIPELLSLLDDMEELSDPEIDQHTEQFIHEWRS